MWIPIAKDTMPNGRVLMIGPSMEAQIVIVYTPHEDAWAALQHLQGLTHWMKLPEGPDFESDRGANEKG